MQLDQVNFPVYYLGKDKPESVEGILFYTYVRDHDDASPELVYNIIDDKNIEGTTLSKRRLKLMSDRVRLHKLSKAVFFISDLLKLTKGLTWFIDSNGKLFSYKKSKRVRLVFKKINKIIKMSAGGALIEVDGISTRYKILYTPKVEQTWAGLLKLDNGYILYGIYDRKYPNTYRSI